MSQPMHPSRSSPLLRRIRRHAGLATLFRAPLDYPDSARQPNLPRARAYPAMNQSLPIEPLAAEPVADRAFAPRTGSAAPATAPLSGSALLNTPTDYLAAPDVPSPAPAVPVAARSAQSPALLQARQAVPQPIAIARAAAPASAQRAVLPAAGPVQGIPAQSVIPAASTITPANAATVPPNATPSAPRFEDTQSLPAVEPPGEAKLSERDWNRLSTIMRSHQAQSEPTPAPGDAAVPAAPLNQPSISQVTSPALQPAASAPADVAATIQPAHSPASTAPALVEQTAQPTQAAAQPTARLVESQAAAPSHAAQPIQRNAQPVPESAAAQPVAPAAPSVEDTLPALESAWPVQRRISQDVAVPQTPASPSVSPLAAPAVLEPLPLAEQERHVQHIQHALAGVSASQPSASVIEVIPPRQTRPIAAAVNPGIPTERPASTPSLPPLSLQPTAIPVRNAAVTAAVPASVLAAGPITAPAAATAAVAAPTPATNSAAAATVLVQRSPDEQSSTGAHLVETEIGPLPADLWGLIGQPAPSAPQAVPPSPPAATAQAVQSQPLSGQPVSPSTVQRTVIINDVETHITPTAPARSGPSTAESAPAEPTPASDSAETMASQSPAAAPTAPGSPTAAAPTSTPDLDEIARQVYAEIKNRLQVEFERLRRRT